jgi:hypothetical protein
MINKFIDYVGGIGSFGTISAILFIGVFTGALIWAWRQNKSFLNEMSAMPLDDGGSACRSATADTKGRN